MEIEPRPLSAHELYMLGRDPTGAPEHGGLVLSPLENPSEPSESWEMRTLNITQTEPGNELKKGRTMSKGNTPTPVIEGWLPVRMAAEVLGVTAQTVHRWVRIGELDSKRTTPRRMWVNEEQVGALLVNQGSEPDSYTRRSSRVQRNEQLLEEIKEKLDVVTALLEDVTRREIEKEVASIESERA